MLSPAGGVIRHDDAETGLHDAFDLDLRESLLALGGEARIEDLALCLDVIPERLSRNRVLHEDEVPRLGVADTRCRVRGAQDPPKHIVVDRLTRELGAYVAASSDDFVEVVICQQRHGGSRSFVARPVSGLPVGIDRSPSQTGVQWLRKRVTGDSRSP